PRTAAAAHGAAAGAGEPRKAAAREPKQRFCYRRSRSQDRSLYRSRQSRRAPSGSSPSAEASRRRPEEIGFSEFASSHASQINSSGERSRSAAIAGRKEYTLPVCPFVSISKRK